MLTTASELPNVAEEMIGTYALSAPFLADLKMKKILPFYHPKSGGRCMLVYYENCSSFERNKLNSVRDLAKKVSESLHNLKIKKVSIFASKEFTANKMLIAHFVN